MTATKGFVEMTGIDAETSQDIAEVIIFLPINSFDLKNPQFRPE